MKNRNTSTVRIARFAGIGLAAISLMAGTTSVMAGEAAMAGTGTGSRYAAAREPLAETLPEAQYAMSEIEAERESQDEDTRETLQEDTECFFRIDRDDPEAWRDELENVRFLTDVNMSGSAQFSEDQFHDLAQQLREVSDDVWIVDCRLESHGLANGIAVSLCSEDNAANLGKEADEVMTEEEELSSLIGAAITAFTTEKDQPIDSTEILVETWKTEKTLVEEEGFRYLRLACPDHCWPPANVIDDFIAMTQIMDDDAWLHFHCQAGSGRTGAFMTIYEMMQRPDASVEEILQHQAETGSGNLLDHAAPEKSFDQKARSVMGRAMYRYINENRESDYEQTWSSWIQEHTQTETLKIGESLDAEEGFSCAPLILSDSLEAVGEGQAIAISGDTVYYVTVE